MAQDTGFWKTAIIKTGRGLRLFQRIVLGVLFWAVVAALIVLAFKSRAPRVPDKAALVLNPKGAVVEQLSGDPLSRLTSQGEPESMLKDLLDAIHAAKDDRRVQVLVLDLDSMGSVGMSKLLDLKAALAEFRKSGKKVIAASDDFSQSAYFLAAQADEIYLHPMGMVLLTGFSQYVPYLKDGLDKLELEVHVFRVGEYKSASEPFMRNSMSEEAKQANLAYLEDMWNVWLREAAAGRKLKVEELRDYIDRFKDSLVQNQGQAAQMALSAKLVDKLANRDELRDRMISLVGEDEETHTFRQIQLAEYLKTIGGDRYGQEAKGNLVGVVVAQGQIYDGTRPPGVIGGDSTAALIREARLDKNIKAIVLRVDSPGGSAFASEVIRRECAMTRKAGKPIVVSMGSVAASGGYWVSTASDEIWASPATITGSIGVFGMFPTYSKPLAKYLGVHVDGIGTTPLAGALRMDQPFNPAVGEVIQQIINRVYEDFLQRVSEARKMDRAAVDKIARGRVWSGEDALQLGLIDKLGGLPDAIDSAASLAKLGKDFKVRYIEPKMTWKEKLATDLLSGYLRIVRAKDISAFDSLELMVPASALARQAAVYAGFNDPKGAYAYCPFTLESK
jgi:protease-4